MDKTQKIILVLSLVAIIFLSVASITGLRVGQQLSEVETEVVLTSSDKQAVEEFLKNIQESFQNDAEKYLDENEPLGIKATEKLGIEVDAVLFDSNGKRYDLPSSFLGIPQRQLTLTDEEGRLLDLGSLQLGLFAVTESEERVQVQARYKVLLNEKQITEKSLFGLGFTTDKALLLKTGAKEAFTFTFADEPTTNFIEGELTNVFKVVIFDIEAVVGEGFNTRQFIYKDEFPIFIMRMNFDGEKAVVRDYTGKAVSVWKSDNNLILCGETAFQDPPTLNGFNSVSNPPTVNVLKDGKPIITASFTVGKSTQPFTAQCKTFEGLPRETNLVFEIEGKNYPLVTPSTQQNYNIKCTLVQVSSTPIKHPFDVNQIVGQKINYESSCTSNIGFVR